ncbi:UNVERIFIED_CONTAM: Retrovirus-related Pol polyprotein from transposon RE2 [Sesamum calycinum]|uniref:Retrovirus-related Pol polyprotein from transposon RE2 n=1 Tax=Sesamum calycinum TaxID=2727403 RepID=A0AAW2JU33_9LAMI
MMSFTKLPPSFWGYSLETAAKLLNMAPSNMVCGYPKKTAGYYFYDLSEQKIFVSRNAVLLEKGFPADSQRMRSTRESRPPERYGFVGLTIQLDNDPRAYREAISDIDLDKWLEAIKFEMNSIGSNQARLVAKGYTQRPEVDFEETYSLIAMAKSIRVLLAIAVWSIYGLRQTSQSWNTHFDEVIRGYDFIKNKHDPCVYKKISSSSVAYLVLYVDDILLIGNDVKMLGDIIAWLSMQFSMKVIDIRHAPRRRTGAVKTTLNNLKRTKDMFLIYGGGELILEGYSDASFQLDDDDAKSQSGFIFKLNGGVVAWKSSKQAITADSNTEAEYIAAAEAAKEVVSMKNYIQELGVVPRIAEPVVIFYYNNGAITQAKEPRSHHCSKHF